MGTVLPKAGSVVMVGDGPDACGFVCTVGIGEEDAKQTGAGQEEIRRVGRAVVSAIAL
jgi:hypothetical protein